ncbi:carbohydrate ABC transporter permease [Streptomyces sp. YIM S03343]
MTSALDLDPSPRKAGFRPMPSRRRRAAHGRSRLGFASPALTFLAALSIYPIYVLIRMSVSQVSSGTVNQAWPFVGLRNFRALWDGPDLGSAAVRTAVFVAVVTVLGVAGGLGVALVMRGNKFTTSVLLAVMVFVWALPPVVNGSVWKFLLADNGLINGLLRDLHLSDGVPFLYDQHLALYSVALVNAWAVIPFNALVFRAALLNIDPSILEAASLDGANKWREARSILIPSARPTAFILTILTIVYAFRSFDFVYVMTAGGPGQATTTLPYLSYTQAFTESDFGIGSATGVISLLIVAALAVVYVRAARKEAE